MREERDAALFNLAETAEPAEQLNQRPVAEHHPGGKCNRRDVDRQNDQRVHADSGIQQQVRAQDSADRSRCAHHGDDRVGTDERLRGGGHDPAQEIENQELPVPGHIFDVVSKDPEKQHVADQVEPAAVHEHRRDHGPVLRHGVYQTHHTGRQRHSAPGRDAVRDLARNEAQLADRPGQWPLRSRPLH